MRSARQKELPLARGSDRPEDAKRRLIMAVRAACRAQSIGDDDRKALQLQLTGKASLADMNFAEMAKVLDHLNRGRERPQADRPHIAKIRALWWSLYWLGAVDSADEAAIDTFVQRQAGVAKLRWLDSAKSNAIVEALKAWAAREGVRWPNPADDSDRMREQGYAGDKHERYAVLQAIGIKLERTGRVLAWQPYVETALKLGLNHWHWSPAQYDAAIRFLGAKRRGLLGKTSV